MVKRRGVGDRSFDTSEGVRLPRCCEVVAMALNKFRRQWPRQARHRNASTQAYNPNPSRSCRDLPLPDFTMDGFHMPEIGIVY
jgi:hypothetical protein